MYYLTELRLKLFKILIKIQHNPLDTCILKPTPVQGLYFISIILFLVGIILDSTSINIKNSNSFFIIILNLVFIIYNIENACSQLTCMQDSMNIFVYQI